MAAPWGAELEDGGETSFFQPSKWADSSKVLSVIGYRLWDKALTEGEAVTGWGRVSDVGVTGRTPS